MDLYIVEVERGDRRDKFAAHAYNREDAERFVLARRTGWQLVGTTLENFPRVIHLASEDLEPVPEERATFTEDQVLALMDEVRETGHCATNKDILGHFYRGDMNNSPTKGE